MQAARPNSKSLRLVYGFKLRQSRGEYGYKVIPVNPGHDTIESLPVIRNLSDLPKNEVDTITLYANPAQGEKLKEQIVAIGVKRVICNPGTESDVLSDYLTSHGVGVVEACTLLMLQTNQF